MCTERQNDLEGFATDPHAAQLENRRLSEALAAAYDRLRIIESANQTRRDHTVQNLQSAGRISAMEEALAMIARVHETLAARAAALEDAVVARDRLIESLLSSHSWRLTAPLRHVRRLLFRTGGE